MWKFYVYELIDAGVVAYVGKGSGRRLHNQCRNRGLIGREVARFKRERDAYSYEVERITEQRPMLNVHKGGNGAKAERRTRRCSWELEIERIGTKKYAAQVLMKFLHLCDPSKVDRIRQVANG